MDRWSTPAPRTSTCWPPLAEALGLEVPAQSDGLSLMPFVQGENPPWWRTQSHWEYDWRWERILFGPYPWPWDRRLESMNLAVVADDDSAYVQFADGDGAASTWPPTRHGGR